MAAAGVPGGRGSLREGTTSLKRAPSFAAAVVARPPLPDTPINAARASRGRGYAAGVGRIKTTEWVGEPPPRVSGGAGHR